MTQYKLNHITDLASLSDEDVAKFAAELPSIVATLRVVERAAKAQGDTLKDMFPVMTYDSTTGSEHTVNAGEKSITIQGKDALIADQTHQILEKAAGKRPSP